MLNKVLKIYVEQKYPEEPEDVELVKMLKKTISEKIVNEHIDQIQNEQAKIQAKAEREMQNKKLMGKIKEAKDIAVFAIGIGFLIGLLVNQLTEVAWFFKGNGFNPTWTALCIAALVGVICMVYKILYLDKIGDLLNKQFEVD